MKHFYILAYTGLIFFASCAKNGSGSGNNSIIHPLTLKSITIQNRPFSGIVLNQPAQPIIKMIFEQPLKPGTITEAISLQDAAGNIIPLQTASSDGDAGIIIKPSGNLAYLTKYNFTVNNRLQSVSGGSLQAPVNSSFVTALDSSRKFPALTTGQLLDKIQQQTLKYFWEFAHPASGMIREGSKHSPDIVTSGGTGFGIMALIAGMERGFINKTEGLIRIQKIVTFLKDKAQRFHGAFPHWMNGASGAVIPFSANDNGADLVETSLLMMGLITARQYFAGVGTLETNLRNDINNLWNAVEWNWFRQNSQNVLYWHWSPTTAWSMNLKIQGWNECLITYVLAASSTTYAITKEAYDNGWARNGAFKNGNAFYNYTLPLGENMGGPLFLEHYSFMGINPNGLSDAYASYQTQTKNHTLINYEYCKANPKGYYGYSDSVWGLTASNIKDGYTASSPTNDRGFIAPTAAISSMPYTPNESMAALHFFYYVLGDKLFKEYGFVDAFSLDVVKNNGAWFADAHLAIDQGPIVVMIENYRSGLLWNLFMSAPEVKAGMKKLGFNSPGL